MSNEGNFGNANPYQTNATEDHAIPVEADKPTSMVVFGILNLVWGILGLLAMVAGLLFQSLGIKSEGNNPIQGLIEDPTYHTIGLVMQGVGIALTITLVISGIGLIGGKGYGRTAANVYGGFAMLTAVAMLIINAIFITMPIFAQAEEMQDPGQKVGMFIAGSSVLIVGLCSFIYPVLLLIFVNRAPVINYLKSQRQI